MKVEFQLNQVIVKPQEIGENCPNLISCLQSYLPTPKTKKRRTTRRKKKIVSSLIDPIIDSLEEE